ncbi:MAG: RnfABCDGE type electron transport complex subunit B [Desulfamplus sp.]|nr:RnfABCDGE type electron transport complex subunit B [Desulfamplus sp.]
MIQSVIMMGGLGLIIGGALAFASKIFYVYVDPLVLAIDDALPGANCGGCGFPGCTPNAEAIAKGKSSPDSCVAAGPDVAEAIAAIMGVSIGAKEPEIARSGCFYGTRDADIKYLYDGIDDCRAAAMVFGGMKECNIGCLGMATCVKACPFDALEMGEYGLPVVDVERCTGCGTCENICPKNIIRLTSVSMRIMKEYTEDKCITPCQRACPTGIDIREYVARTARGDYAGAVQVIKERNPFPTVIGRICPAPCESECRRQLIDESVGINNLKRFVCDIEMELGKRIQPYKAPETGRRIAVVGGGVEGLSAAFFTARLGHSPTVFEATSTLGGLLRIAIADERLPMDVLDWDIEGILGMGVNVKTGMKLGDNISVPDLLKKGYEAVFTATGGWDSRLSRGELSTAATVFPGGYLMIDLLREDVQGTQRIPCHGNVVIAGGGQVVAEAVNVCREQGARSITIVSRKSSEAVPFDDKTMEIINSHGATIIYGGAVTRVIGEEDSLCQVECTYMASGEKVFMDADTLILASGRFPELVFMEIKAEEMEVDAADDTDSTASVFADGKPLKPLRWEGREIYKVPSGNLELGLLSPQDELSGYSAAVAAINGGRRSAATIHKMLHGLPVNDVKRPVTPNSILQGVSCLESVQIMPKNPMPLNDKTDGEYKGKHKELYKGYTPETAVSEAQRCLKCGLLCYERRVQQEEEAQQLLS